jgi:hypothetical protein
MIASITEQLHLTINTLIMQYFIADPRGRAVYVVGLLELACYDCDFDSRLGHGCLSVTSAECCQVEVSASGRSLDQMNPT